MNNPDPVAKLLIKEYWNKTDLVALLSCREEDSRLLFEKAAAVKKEYVGNKVYLRGLIEYSNFCSKNCYYCGIRAGNSNYVRYQMTDEEVFEAVKYANENN